METILIGAAVFILFFIAYRFYARGIERVLGVDPQRKTPAYTKYDGVDYVPARNWLVLFGHHFSSIAGAAPIIGPVLAISLWGWGPSILWIILGCIFFGGVHDFSALVTSVRSGGVSLADIAGETISRRAKLVFSIFVLLTLILIVSVFVYLCANTFVDDGRITIPSLGLIFIAVLVGGMLYKLKYNQTVSTILGLVLLAGLLFLGSLFPIKAGTIQIWIIILLIYSYIASILPVNILLQPRDYLSSFLLFAGIIFGYGGIIVSHRAVNLPAFIAWDSSSGWLWPMLCVTIACGAISGFHSLIAGGTTAKQLPDEKYSRRIGYGAMLMEGIVSTLALLVTIGGLANIDSLKTLISTNGPIGVFSKGFGVMTMPILGGLGTLLAVLILNAFILTTLDTATRISRYVFEELTGLKNRWISTAVVVIAAGWLAWGGKWKTVWPVFGAANQLVAALTLFVVTCWLLARARSIRYVIFPAFFMFATTSAALVYQIYSHTRRHEWLLLAISAVLLSLALYMFAEAVKVISRGGRRQNQQNSV